MNLDINTQFTFGDAEGLRNFMLAHRFVHRQTADALTAQFSVAASSFGLTSAPAEEAWVSLMRDKEASDEARVALADWLKFHADMHTQAYTLLSRTTTAAPDLSNVDFASEEQFYEWMLAHQEMHEFEQSSLGLT